MKWLIGCLVALCMVSAAVAGEDPYLAIVGNDIGANPFYLSPKYLQFAFDQEDFWVPVCDLTGPFIIPGPYRNYARGCEQFRSQTPVNQPEVCDTTGVVNGVGDFSFFGEPNARVTAGNSGWYEWYIRLPKKPNGELNLVLQCGVLKPNAFGIYEFDAVELCAAETGERVEENCTREEVNPGTNPVIDAALPTIIAKAYPGLYANPAFGSTDGTPIVNPFNLTAFRNPGTYALDIVPAPGISASTQVLDGSAGTKVLLKSCMDKSIVVKLPVTGQLNAANQTEYDLEAGDIIRVRMDIPRAGTTDIYCHAQSLRVMGIGESPF